MHEPVLYYKHSLFFLTIYTVPYIAPWEHFITVSRHTDCATCFTWFPQNLIHHSYYKLTVSFNIHDLVSPTKPFMHTLIDNVFSHIAPHIIGSDPCFSPPYTVKNHLQPTDTHSTNRCTQLYVDASEKFTTLNVHVSAQQIKSRVT
jgi:hypothetical protein